MKLKKEYIYFVFIFFVFVIGIVNILLDARNLNKNSNNCEYDFVEKVYDGDTVRTKKLGKIRLLGIDTPEIYHDGWEVKSYKFYGCGNIAKKIADQYLLHKNIKFCFDKKGSHKGGYNRLLAYAMVNSGSNELPFGAIILEKGYAKVYKNASFEYKTYFEELEKKARQQKIGIWSEYCKNKDIEFKKKHLLSK